MNRIATTWNEALPKPTGAFTPDEALVLVAEYTRCPADLSCPLCGPDTIRVLAFIELHVKPGGWATLADPADPAYAAALYCHGCARAIGIIVNSQN